MVEDTTPDLGARWRLEEISASPQAAIAGLEAALADAEALAADGKGRLGEISGPELAGLLERYEALVERKENLSGYAHLRLYADMADPEAADILARAREVEQLLSEALCWVELEWAALPEQVTEPLTLHPALAHRHHWLTSVRRFGPHMLSEAEERVLSARDEVAQAAWEQLHSRLVGSMMVPVRLPGARRRTRVSFGEAMGMVRHPDPATRRSMLEGMSATLEPITDTLAACYDSRVCDRLVIDRLRDYEHPMQAANLANQLPDALVDGLVETVAAGFPIAREWFTTKGSYLGQSPLELPDLYAPIGSGDLRIGWPEAVDQVGAAFDSFSPEVGSLARGLMAGGHLDPGVRAGKRPGAFCAPIGADVAPFLMLAFDGGIRAASTLAHELGHGVHTLMSSARHGALDYRTGTAMAEIPSTFFELVFRDLALERLPDDTARATLRCSMLEDTFAIVFRQVQMTRFEQHAYQARAEGRALDAGRLGELWTQTNREYFGESVDLPAFASRLWSYIPHFIVARFYTYAYSFAYLCAVSLHARWREDPQGMSQLISDALLRRGGSAAPELILSDLGFDVSGTQIWDEGLAAIAGEVSRAKRDLALLA